MNDRRYNEDPRVKGEVAEHLFVVECLKHGVEICKPCSQNPRYDFLIKSEDGWKRAQIKYASTVKGNDDTISFSKTKNQNGRKGKVLTYTSDEIDYLFGYNPQMNQWYNIPFKEMGRVIILRIGEAKGTQANNKNINKAEDYILDFNSI
jgi:hypothetical protein